MPRPEFKMNVNDRPERVPRNFRKLSPLEAKGKVYSPHNGIWHGSGVSIDKLPSYEYYYEDCRFCGNCGAEALCIYVMHWEDLVGKAVVIELFCEKCGKFTVYEWQY
jgi:hypothetical protein